MKFCDQRYTHHTRQGFLGLLLLMQASACSLVLEEVPQPDGLIDENAIMTAGEMAGETAGEDAGDMAGDQAGEIAGEEAGEYIPPEQTIEPVLCESEACDSDDLAEAVSCQGLDLEINQVETCSGIDCALPAVGENNNLSNEQRALRSYKAWELYFTEARGEFLPERVLSSPNFDDLARYQKLPKFWFEEPSAPEGEYQVGQEELVIAPFNDCERVAGSLNTLVRAQNEINGSTRSYTGFIETSSNGESLSFNNANTVIMGTCGAHGGLTLIDDSSTGGANQSGVETLILGSAQNILIDGLTVRDRLEIRAYDESSTTTGSTVRIENLKTDSLQRLVIESSKVDFATGSDNPIEMRITPGRDIAVDIKNSVVSLAGIIAIQNAEPNLEDGALVRVKIKDSTLILTNEEQNAFELSGVSLEVESTLIISNGPVFKLTDSKVNLENTYLLSHSEQEQCSGTFFELNNTQANISGQWLRTCQEHIYKADTNSGVVLETIIARDISTLLEKDFAESSTVPNQENALSYIQFSGQLLLKSYSEDYSQNFETAWERWITDYPNTDFIKLPIDSHQMSLHHIYAQGRDNVELLQITGGGSYLLSQSHLNGFIFMGQIASSIPALRVQDSFLEGYLLMDQAYIELSKSLFGDLSIDLLNNSYFIADQLMQTNDENIDLTLSAEQSFVALNGYQGSASFDLTESQLYTSYSKFNELSNSPPPPIFDATSSSLFIFNSQTQATLRWFHLEEDSYGFFNQSQWLSPAPIMSEETTDRFLSLGVNYGELYVIDSKFQDQRTNGFAFYLAPSSLLQIEQSRLEFQQGYGIYADQVDDFFFNQLRIEQLVQQAESEAASLSSVALYLSEAEESSSINEDSLELQSNAAIVLKTESESLNESNLSCHGSIWIGDCPTVMSPDQSIEHCSLAAENMDN